MKRRIALFVFWMLLLALVPSRLAWAYIDPATTTYIIQVVTALVITLGVSLSIFVYRFQMIITNVRVWLHALRRRLSKQQKSISSGYSPSENKQDYSEISLTEEEALSVGLIDYPAPVRQTYPALASYDLGIASSEEAETVSDTSIETGRLKRVGKWLWEDQRSFKNRLSKATLISASVTMTYGIFNMFDSFITNKAQVIFTFTDVVGPILVFSLILFVTLSLMLICCKGRVFSFVICLTLSFLVCGYLQSTFLNSGIGQLLGAPIEWKDLGVARVLVNLLVWIAIFATIFFLGFSHHPKMRQLFKGILLFVPSLLIAVQLVALFTILPPADEWKGDQGSGAVTTLSREELFEVSTKSNIYIFLVDTMDEDFINMIVNDDPQFFDSLDGFTRFTNNISVYNMTYPSLIHLLTDVPFDASISADEYIEEAYTHRSFINDIKDQGYVSNIYTEKPHSFSEARQLEGIADNLGESVYSLKSWKIPLQLFRLSLLRSAPLSLKFVDILYPDLSYTSIGTLESGVIPYWSDDPLFFEELIDEGLKTVDEPHFIFYHLNGFHVPYNMDAKAQHVEGGVPEIEQFKGSFFILNEYFKQLKDHGLYKDATIIITGDHGLHNNYMEQNKPMLVGCFVKPAGEEGTPLRYSNAPVTILNIRATCVKAAGGDPTPWGQTYYEVAEDAVVERDYYSRFSDRRGNRFMAHYRITGDANNWNNWELIEMIPIIRENWL